MVFLGLLDESYGYEVGFDTWFLIAAPAAIVRSDVVRAEPFVPYSVPVDERFRLFVKERLGNLGALTLRRLLP